ncbi:N-acetylmuramoyl-L-alanine amidase [Labrenzia sp. DG1229]|uniref:N-acetylmuramoyl-L-alanine amidase n=1 Tax=Labrenzia sp. DG1229 TaxID=681847 RepID=UPI0007C7465E|nr:N-acetylmuramoyl-L-alanine amidase [Labrenzia sp. DG1229]
MRKIDTIVIHCSATPEGRAVSVSTIRQWHLDRGWRDIGYHYVIGLNGEIWPGRPITQRGAHVRGHNTGSIGICYVGGVTNDGRLAPKDTRTPDQKTALLSLIRSLLTDYPQIETICGHRDFPAVKKACPCFDAIPEYEYLIGEVPVPSAKPTVLTNAPTDRPDELCKPSFNPDAIDDREVIIPPQLEKPVVKTVSFWERASQIVFGGGLAFLSPYLQDWRIVAGIGGTIVALAIVGVFFQGRLAKSIRAIREAAS